MLLSVHAFNYIKIYASIYKKASVPPSSTSRAPLGDCPQIPWPAPIVEILNTPLTMLVYKYNTASPRRIYWTTASGSQYLTNESLVESYRG